MTIYVVPKGQNESQVRKLQRARRWLAVISASTLLIASYLCLHSNGWFVQLYLVLSIGSLVILINLWNPFSKRKIYEEIAAAMRIDSFEVDLAGFRMNGSTWSKFVPWDDVTQVEEPPNGRGIYVRTHPHLVWYLISRRTDHYEEIKGQLATIGIPIVQTATPRNWGVLFVILYCASMLCNVLTQDRQMLICNFVFALVLGGAGAVLTNFGVGDRRFKIRSMLGSFLPAAFSAVTLIFTFWFK